MKRSGIYLLSTLVLTLLVLAGWFATKWKVFAPKTIFLSNQLDHYAWLFDSTERPRVRCEYPLGDSTSGKYRFVYTYLDQFRYLIIEDPKFNSLSLDDLRASKKAMGWTPYIAHSEVCNGWWGGHMVFQIKKDPDPASALKVLFDGHSDIQEADSSDYHILKGHFKYVLLQDQNGRNEAFIQFDHQTPGVLIFYKPGNKLFVILINPFEGKTDIQKGFQLVNLKSGVN